MTNLEMLLNSIEKAEKEKDEMIIYESGRPNSNNYHVAHNNKVYVVMVNNKSEIVGCTCPHAYYRKAICKHQILVSLEKGLNIKRLGKY